MSGPPGFRVPPQQQLLLVLPRLYMKLLLVAFCFAAFEVFVLLLPLLLLLPLCSTGWGPLGQPTGATGAPQVEAAASAAAAGGYAVAAITECSFLLRSSFSAAQSLCPRCISSSCCICSNGNYICCCGCCCCCCCCCNCSSSFDRLRTRNPEGNRNCSSCCCSSSSSSSSFGSRGSHPPGRRSAGAAAIPWLHTSTGSLQ